MDSIQLEGFTRPKASGKIEIIIHTVKPVQENRFLGTLFLRRALSLQRIT
jgi:hypothetical protein